MTRRTVLKDGWIAVLLLIGARARYLSDLALFGSGKTGPLLEPCAAAPSPHALGGRTGFSVQRRMHTFVLANVSLVAMTKASALVIGKYASTATFIILVQVRLRRSVTVLTPIAGHRQRTTWTILWRGLSYFRGGERGSSLNPDKTQ